MGHDNIHGRNAMILVSQIKKGEIAEDKIRSTRRQIGVYFKESGLGAWDVHRTLADLERVLTPENREEWLEALTISSDGKEEVVWPDLVREIQTRAVVSV